MEAARSATAVSRPGAVGRRSGRPDLRSLTAADEGRRRRAYRFGQVDARVALCGFDPLTGADHRATIVEAPADAVLVVDGVFAFRPEYDEYWDFRVWIEVPVPVSRERGVTRDTELEGYDEAVRLYDTRFSPSEALYIAEVQPQQRADVVIDKTDIDAPRAWWAP